MLIRFLLAVRWIRRLFRGPRHVLSLTARCRCTFSTLLRGRVPELARAGTIELPPPGVCHRCHAPRTLEVRFK